MKAAKMLFCILLMGLGGYLTWYGYRAVSGQPLSSIFFFGGLLMALAGAMGIMGIASRK